MSVLLLKQLLTKELMKESAKRTGIMTINKNLSKDVEKLLQKYISSAQSQGVDLDTLGEQQLKYIIQLNKPQPPKVYSGQEAIDQLNKIFPKKGEVVDMTGKTMDTSQGIMGGRSVKELMESGQVQKGSEGLKKGQKITDRDMFNNSSLNQPGETNIFSNKYLNDLDKKIIDSDAFGYSQKEWNNLSNSSKEKFRKQFDSNYEDAMENTQMAPIETIKTDTVTDTITYIKTLEPIDAMKEANSIIGRKGKYKNLTPEESKKILTDTEDHIFERDIPIDPEDMATGGRAGYVEGGPIHPRLGELSSGVSSAEEQLQQINQSLQTAETSLGESGPGGAGSVTPSVNGYESSGSSLYNESPAGEVNNPYQAPVGMDNEGMVNQIASPTITAPTNPYDYGGGLGGLLGEGGGNSQPFDNPQFDPQITNLNQLPSGQPQPVSEEQNNIFKDPITGGGQPMPGMDEQDTLLPGAISPDPPPAQSPQPVYQPKLIDNTPEFKKSSDPIMGGFQGSDIFKNMMGGPMTADVQNYTLDGKEMSGSGTYLGGLRKYLESIGKGDLLQRNNSTNGAGPLQSLSQGIGRAGYYMGGQAMVGEDLSDIGHGSDSLMARNMQLSPGSQATTSTGLNYLLGQDNDTVRVPYNEGGPARQNFAMGKRAFLKMLGAGAAGIAGIKTGLLGLGKKEVAKEVVKEAATSGGVPPYFLKLVAKIKSLGDDVTQTQSLAERQNVKRYKDFELTEDTATGRVEIQRYKVSDESSYYGQPLTEETYMSYSPGETIIGKGNKPVKTQPEYQEGTTFVRNDRGYTGEVVDESTTISDDIFEEVGETVPEVIRKTKADGGRIGYSGGGILKAIIAKSAASKGLSVRDFIKATSYKGLPPEIKMYISVEDFARLKSGQKEMYDNFIDMAKTRKSFQENVEGGKGTPVEPLFKNLEKTMDEQSFVPKTVTADDIAEMEIMVRNRFEKGRKLQATGGLATMLGE